MPDVGVGSGGFHDYGWNSGEGESLRESINVHGVEVHAKTPWYALVRELAIRVSRSQLAGPKIRRNTRVTCTRHSASMLVDMGRFHSMSSHAINSLCCPIEPQQLAYYATPHITVSATMSSPPTSRTSLLDPPTPPRTRQKHR